ncbi:MAG TPA: DUF4230 domain-containing protein [Crocinitomicaceae bacterium]|nr:DUF4230 domain-containing protein [Crocinitomicaceae bacterium]
MKQLIFYFFLFFILFSCSEDDKLPNPNVYEIRNIGELSTTEYTVGKIVQLDDKATEWYKYGDRKILISTKAKIKAGIDLTQIKEGDIEVSGTKIIITLPPAKVTSFSMDSEHVHTEMEEINGFRQEFTQQEKNAFLKQGEAAIKRDIADTGILQDANDNAIVFLKDFYKNLGYEEVIVQPTTLSDAP